MGFFFRSFFSPAKTLFLSPPPDWALSDSVPGWEIRADIYFFPSRSLTAFEVSPCRALPALVPREINSISSNDEISFI